jgi:hypothetical protein
MMHNDFCDTPMLESGIVKIVDKKYPPYDFTDLLLVSNGLFIKFISGFDLPKGQAPEPFLNTELDEKSLSKYTAEEIVDSNKSASQREKN